MPCTTQETMSVTGCRQSSLPANRSSEYNMSKTESRSAALLRRKARGRQTSVRSDLGSDWPTDCLLTEMFRTPRVCARAFPSSLAHRWLADGKACSWWSHCGGPGSPTVHSHSRFVCQVVGRGWCIDSQEVDDSGLASVVGTYKGRLYRYGLDGS